MRLALSASVTFTLVLRLVSIVSALVAFAGFSSAINMVVLGRADAEVRLGAQSNSQVGPNLNGFRTDSGRPLGIRISAHAQAGLVTAVGDLRHILNGVASAGHAQDILSDRVLSWATGFEHSARHNTPANHGLPNYAAVRFDAPDAPASSWADTHTMAELHFRAAQAIRERAAQARERDAWVAFARSEAKAYQNHRLPPWMRKRVGTGRLRDQNFSGSQVPINSMNAYFFARSLGAEFVDDDIAAMRFVRERLGIHGYEVKEVDTLEKLAHAVAARGDALMHLAENQTEHRLASSSIEGNSLRSALLARQEALAVEIPEPEAIQISLVSSTTP